VAMWEDQIKESSILCMGRLKVGEEGDDGG